MKTLKKNVLPAKHIAVCLPPHYQDLNPPEMIALWQNMSQKEDCLLGSDVF
jgi:hypothetical protein